MSVRDLRLKFWVQWRKRMNWSYKQNCIKSVSNRVNQLLPEFPEVNIINANRAVFPILSFILFASFFSSAVSVFCYLAFFPSVQKISLTSNVSRQINAFISPNNQQLNKPNMYKSNLFISLAFLFSRLFPFFDSVELYLLELGAWCWWC